MLHARSKSFSTNICRALGAGFVLLAASLAAAESRLPPQVKFKNIDPRALEKLGYINAITQDAEGYMWFAAIKGLARYDGYDVKIFDHSADDPHSLSHYWVKSLQVVHGDQLWAVTHEGLCHYRPQLEGFDCVTLEGETGNHSFYHLFEDSHGRLWVSSSAGIKLLDANTGELKPAPQALTRAIPPSRGSEDNFVHASTEDNQGNLWFGLDNNGLVRYTPSTGAVHHFTHDRQQPGSLPENKVRALLVDSAGNLWVGTLGGGVNRFNPRDDTFELLVHSHNEKADTIWTMMEDRNGLLWIGDGVGVHLFDPLSGEFDDYMYEEGSRDGPANFVPRHIYEDNAGGVWLGYFPSGIDQVDAQASQFLNYRHSPKDPDSLADGGVLSTMETPEGNLWIGCGFGLSLLDRQTGRFQRFVHQQDDPASLSGSTVLDIDQEPDGTLWVGAWDRGLNRRAPGAEGFQHYVFDPLDPHSVFGREPWSILVDNRTRVWVATEKGISRYRRQTDDFVRVMPADATGKVLDSLYTQHINQTDDGMLWVSSYNGLYVLDPDTGEYVEHFQNVSGDPASLSWNQVRTTFQDAQGRIWVGTNGAGLDLYLPETKTFTHFGREHGLPDLAISAIIDDEDGNLWVSTYQGLARLDANQNRFTVFEERDGLVGNLFNRNSPSRLSTGELVFGSTRGVSIFDPRKLKPNGHVPPVVLTGFSIFNQPVQPGTDSPLASAIGETRSVALSFDQSMFSVDFAALDFRSPEENSFAYRLLGFEKKWNQVGNRHSATYTNLDPGRYLFQVKASNDSGIWNPIPRELEIVVAPPWWRTPLAYICYILAVTLVIWRSIHIHRRELSYERNKLQQERAIVRKLKEFDLLKDNINRDLDRKVAERTEELRLEHERLLIAQQELELLNRRLEEASVTDQLTGLKNRRFLHQSLEGDTAIVVRDYLNAIANGELGQRQLNDLSFIVVDIDDFKTVNDHHGHSAGDLILVQLSQLLRRELRDSDYLVRWGGEEFVIVIRHLPRNLIVPIVERIIRSIRDHHYSINDELTLQRTCSIGVAAFPFFPDQPNKASWEQVINIADRALYCAKSSGRDCWVQLGSSADTEHYNQLLHDLENDHLLDAVDRGKLMVSSSKPADSLVWRS